MIYLGRQPQRHEDLTNFGVTSFCRTGEDLNLTLLFRHAERDPDTGPGVLSLPVFTWKLPCLPSLLQPLRQPFVLPCRVVRSRSSPIAPSSSSRTTSPSDPQLRLRLCCWVFQGQGQGLRAGSVLFGSEGLSVRGQGLRPRGC